MSDSDELRAYQALTRCLMGFAKEHPEDENLRRVYCTIARFNLGEMFRPGGSADRYLIPYELTSEGESANNG